MTVDQASPIRVLIVDDQQLIRLGFRMVLDAAEGIEVVGEADDGAAALRSVASSSPDVVLMDVRMPGVDGIEATARIRAEYPGVAVLVLTTFDLDEYAFGALRAGAGGFLLKDARRDELVAAVRAVAAGEATLAPRITRRMIELVTATGLPAPQPVAPSSLTAREADVLAAMARGLTNLEIAAELFLSESTVKTHVGRILTKLPARDRVHAVLIAHGLADPGVDS
ncbi:MULTISPECIES: response regulator transcription factor [Microbacterium]|jgi:DNA-binding NarL/FixJ family response regulator|uniref:response regulator transcription factor n=1 Tax=Microbacterium TaxID=33882 RepID=UPI000FF1E73F|nr:MULTISPECIES: response regulator transcription factor [Microbacterium]RKE63151.1 LuxR family two component transcriptional regulator [Microbacterium sp. AG238]WJM17216.1 response regulator transcription factor [Microbacterium arborescens]